MRILHEEETAFDILQETGGLVQEVTEDIQNLKPNVILETLKSWIPGLMTLGYRLLMATIVLIIGIRVIKLAKRFLERTFQRMEMEAGLRKFLLSVSTVFMYLLLSLMVADKMGINPGSVVALIGSAGVAVALSLQESLSNFAGGIVILLVKPFIVNDYIVTPQIEGTVTDIGLLYTHLLTIDNKAIVIPNGGLANSSITNVTAQDQRRLDFFVNITYQSDLKKAKEVLFQVVNTHPFVLHEEGRMPEVVVFELKENAITLSSRTWVATGNYWTLKFDITEVIKLEFDKAGIEIARNCLYENQKQ